MKKYYSVILGVIICFLVFVNITPAATQNDLKIKVDGVLLKSDVSPIQVNNRLLVPVRVLVEKLGASVKWNEKTKRYLYC